MEGTVRGIGMKLGLVLFSQRPFEIKPSIPHYTYERRLPYGRTQNRTSLTVKSYVILQNA